MSKDKKIVFWLTEGCYSKNLEATHIHILFEEIAQSLYKSDIKIIFQIQIQICIPNKKTKSENRLFSTLDPYLKRCGLPKKEYIISDTVGFIKNLPTSLIIAFRATLEEISFSDLIVHVVDVSDEYADKNAEVVYSTLEALGVDTGNKNKIIEAHNKIDISSQQRFPPFLKVLPKKRIFSISAEKKQGLDQLHLRP